MLDERIARTQLRDIQRTVVPMVFVAKIFVALSFFEIGQHVIVRPAGIAKPGPLVVIGAMAADINHRVDRARAAEGAAARLIAPPPIQPGLRHRLECPIVDLRRQHERRRHRRIDDPIVAGIARFQQTHIHPRIFAQAARDDATCRPAADNDVIESRHVAAPHAAGFGATSRAGSPAAGTSGANRRASSRWPRSRSGRMNAMPIAPVTAMMIPQRTKPRL